MRRQRRPLYRDRRLALGYPALDELSLAWFERALANRPDDTARLQEFLGHLNRLIDLETRKRMLLVGCGPRPEEIRILRERGFDVTGIEPVPRFVAAARRYLDDEDAVIVGRAEELPVASGSSDVVVLESVLEHVESVRQSLSEAHRVLAPGGVAYVGTTNRRRLGRGDAEFNLPFFGWFPKLVKESYVFRHLHYDPALANFTERPAVHWFTFAELCEAGREEGFFQFYSYLDLKEPDASHFSGDPRSRRLKARALRYVQTYPWLRALALTQRGGTIFMLKRPAD
jgi:SAM-dependent methyltransferase